MKKRVVVKLYVNEKQNNDIFTKHNQPSIIFRTDPRIHIAKFSGIIPSEHYVEYISLDKYEKKFPQYRGMFYNYHTLNDIVKMFKNAHNPSDNHYTIIESYPDVKDTMQYVVLTFYEKNKMSGEYCMVYVHVILDSIENLSQFWKSYISEYNNSKGDTFEIVMNTCYVFHRNNFGNDIVSKSDSISNIGFILSEIHNDKKYFIHPEEVKKILSNLEKGIINKDNRIDEILRMYNYIHDNVFSNTPYIYIENLEKFIYIIGKNNDLEFNIDLYFDTRNSKTGDIVNKNITIKNVSTIDQIKYEWRQYCYKNEIPYDIKFTKFKVSKSTNMGRHNNIIVSSVKTAIIELLNSKLNNDSDLEKEYFAHNISEEVIDDIINRIHEHDKSKYVYYPKINEKDSMTYIHTYQ